MTIDMKLVRAALKASGLSGRATWAVLLPFGRERRVLALLHQRHSVLEAKNSILDTLSRSQRPLEALGLHAVEDVTRALADPEQGPRTLVLGLSRGVLEDEASRWGTELGSNFTQALSELQTDARVLRACGPAGEDLYLIAPRYMQQRYDLAPLNRMLQRGQEFGTTLRTRERNDSDNDPGRMYRM